MHWANKYIGLTYKLGGADPSEGLDCWSFFRLVQKEQYGLTLPEVTLTKTNYHTITGEFRLNPEFSNWREIDKLQDGDAVMMRVSKYPNHIGIWIDDDRGVQGVLHTLHGSGSIFSSAQGLRQQGWTIHSYYRHNDK